MRDPVQLFSDRSHTYIRFIRSVRYPQGIRAYFLRSPLLSSGLHVLDAGCGTGVVTLALRDALLCRGLAPGPMQAFDLTPAMLGRFREELVRLEIADIELAQADVLALSRLPASWSNYDLVVSASMLEYLPPTRLSTALRGLRSLLKGRRHLRAVHYAEKLADAAPHRPLVAIQPLHGCGARRGLSGGRLHIHRASYVPTPVPVPRALGYIIEASG